MIYLRTNKVSVHRGQRRILQVPDQDWRGGTLVNLYGPNGAGKTSFLRACAGLLSLRVGSITTSAARAYLDGRLPWIESWTVEECLQSHALCYQIALDPLQSVVANGGLRLSQRLAHLSKGQRALLGLLATLSQPLPTLWCLDEPFNHLDSDKRSRIEQLFREKAQAGHLLMITTHQPLEGWENVAIEAWERR